MNSLLIPSATYAASTRSEVEEIQTFRYEIYAEKMKLLNLPGMDHERKLLVDSLDESGIHLYLRAASELIGAVRLNINAVPRGLEAPLEASSLPLPFVYCSRLYVREGWRGKGGVAKLSQAAFNYFRQHSASVAICHCYPRLINLYAGMGFEQYGTPFLAPGLEYLGLQYPLRCFLAEQTLQLAA